MIWEPGEDIKKIVKDLKDANYPDLNQASIWVLVNDANPLVDNRLTPVEARICTTTEKFKSGHDFKIVIRARAWEKLTDDQRKIALDEALSRCGVRYKPQTVTVNGKEEPIKDDLGRILYSSEIMTDDSGTPKWKMNRPDVSAFFALIKRYGSHSVDIENFVRVLNGQDPVEPSIPEPQAS
jgi:hypothetical protein